MPYAFLIASALAFFGLVGADAFNPDDGFLIESEPLWRVFGIAAYIGWIAIPLIAVAGVSAWMWKLIRRRWRLTPE